MVARDSRPCKVMYVMETEIFSSGFTLKQCDFNFHICSTNKALLFVKIPLSRVFSYQKLFWGNFILLAVTIECITESLTASVKESSFYINQKSFVSNLLFEKQECLPNRDTSFCTIQKFLLEFITFFLLPSLITMY